MTVSTPLEPGRISPRREVPASIVRPFYVDSRPGTPADHDDPMVKDADTIARMRVAGRIADSRPLDDGDVVKVDITAFVDGVHGDTCATYYAGDVAPEVRDLGEHTREAMLRGIRAIRPGRPVSVIGRVIESYARRFGYGVVRDYTGHGVGPSFHTKPTILHYDEPRADTPIEVGMTFTVEPMLTLGGYDWVMWDDGWTVLTKDGSWAAQWEHTVVVTEDGAEILTAPSD